MIDQKKGDPLKVLLTGASGFVGSYMQGVLPCVPLVSGGQEVDLRRPDELRQPIRTIRPDAVIHLAAQSFVPRSFLDPVETFDINFYGTFNLLNALEQEGFSGSFLFVSSGDTYGVVPPERLPIVEDQPLRPRNPYAVSKVAAEALCFQWSVKSRFKIVMARSFNHIGPRQRTDFVVSDFAKQVAEIRKGLRGPVIRTGDIEVTRDFTDVRDIVRAYQMLLERGENGEIYNVCSGREVRISNILSRLIEIAGVQVAVEPDPERMRSAEQKRNYGSYAKLHNATGWQPKIELEQTLQDILEYWERELEKK
jgi:GDP-4-dehydro-6-deoxy-D-mannose reductase